MNRAQPFWAPETILPHRCMSAQAGVLRVWVLHTGDQAWQVHTRVQETPATEPLRDAEVPADAAWVRFVVPSAEARVRLTPTLPAAAVVIRPATPIEILPGGTAQIYVSIPCWVQVRLGEKGEQILREYETKPLSKTWFGSDTQTGELCYSIRSRARRTLEEITDTNGRVIVPMVIRNSSVEKLSFSRLCIRAPHMSVYGTSDGTLWANQVTLHHHAGKEAAELKLSDAAPTQARHATLLCPPRSPPKSHALRDLFSFL